MIIIALRQRFAHMGNHSGYDLLFNELQKEKNVINFWFNKKKKNFIIEKILLFIKYKLIKYKTPFYSHYSIIPEFRIFIFCLLRPFKKKVIHISYMEDNLGLLADKRLNRFLKNTIIVSTTHQPASWWKLRANPEMIKNLDALIVLSNVEKEFFDYYLKGNVFFIPHGVDHNFFKPAFKQNQSFYTCLFSGQWLRDINLLIKLIEELIKKDEKIIFNLVYPQNLRDNKELLRIARFNQVNWFSGLNDFELKKLYQEADILLLPLIDCTANNALLEAMASGLPVVTNRLKALDDYCPKEGVFQFENNKIDEMVDTIIYLKNNVEIYKNPIREHVILNYTWEIISNSTIELYEQIYSKINYC